MTAASARRPTKAASTRVGERQEALAGYALIAVPMLLFLVLNIGSILYAAFISLWKWNIRTGPVTFLGLNNYVNALTDSIFQAAVTNTVYYTVIWVPLTMALGLFLAVIVNQKIRGRTFFRGAFYFPAIASSAAISTIWIFIMNPFGLFNQVRGILGINPLFALIGFGPNQDWLGDYHTAMNGIIILNAWTTSGTFMIFYLAALQAIPHEVYEAAAIDGAGAWDTFRRITFPLLRPGHFFVATVGVIGGLQLFDQAVQIGNVDGAPANSLMTLVLYLYNAAFKRLQYGSAAAAGVLLFLIIFAATLIQRRLFEGREPTTA
ncbi:MAG TPA: sugar ABC transporter permease [Patescibacteria group bacterium]|jgi:multiple sugar transport system permease protein|nr:sugar ABC transporter permease [Patescibacteria group bacterium]